MAAKERMIGRETLETYITAPVDFADRRPAIGAIIPSKEARVHVDAVAGDFAPNLVIVHGRGALSRVPV